VQLGRTWRRLDGRLSLGLESKHGRSGVEAKEGKEKEMEEGRQWRPPGLVRVFNSQWLVGRDTCGLLSAAGMAKDGSGRLACGHTERWM